MTNRRLAANSITETFVRASCILLVTMNSGYVLSMHSKDAQDIAALTSAGKHKEAADEWLKRYNQLGCEGDTSEQCIDYARSAAWAMFWAERYQDSYRFFDKIPMNTYLEICSAERTRGLIANKIKMDDIAAAASIADGADGVFPMDYCDSSWTKPEELFGDPSNISISPRASVPALRAWILNRQARKSDLEQLLSDQAAIFVPLKKRLDAIREKSYKECTVANYKTCEAAKERSDAIQFREAASIANAKGQTKYTEFFKFWTGRLEKSASDWDRLAARDAQADAFAKNFAEVASAFMMGYAATKNRNSNAMPQVASPGVSPVASPGVPPVSSPRASADLPLSEVHAPGRDKRTANAFATECLSLTTNRSGNAIANRCNQYVNFAFCGMDAGGSESVGVCGKDIGGARLGPRQVMNLTQSRKRTNYFYIACYDPYVPYQARFTGDAIQARCYR